MRSSSAPVPLAPGHETRMMQGAVPTVARRYPTYCTTEAYDHERVVAAVGLENLKNWWPNAKVRRRRETQGKGDGGAACFAPWVADRC